MEVEERADGFIVKRLVPFRLIVESTSLDAVAEKKKTGRSKSGVLGIEHEVLAVT